MTDVENAICPLAQMHHIIVLQHDHPAKRQSTCLTQQKQRQRVDVQTCLAVSVRNYNAYEHTHNACIAEMSASDEKRTQELHHVSSKMLCQPQSSAVPHQSPLVLP